MIVTNADIEQGRLAILPVGWQRHGQARAALFACTAEWRAEDRKRTVRGEPPQGFGLVMEGDSDLAVVREVVPERRMNGGLVLRSINENGDPASREVPMDFDVVEVATSLVLAEARRSV